MKKADTLHLFTMSYPNGSDESFVENEVKYLAAKFKKIYVYDPEISTMHIDWRMTKKGLNLMVMQTPSIHEKMARWLWELAEL